MGLRDKAVSLYWFIIIEWGVQQTVPWVQQLRLF